MSTFPPMFRKFLFSLLLTASIHGDERWAPNAVAGPVNQLVVSGNACGPAALLTSLRCGDESWQSISETIPGSSDRSKLLYIIKAHGLRDSNSLQGRKRWSQHGINAEDLTQIASELASMKNLRAPRSESLFRRGREKPAKLIERLHHRLRDSLKRGFPPILSLKRYVYRDGQWLSLQGHFVTVVQVPEKIERKASSFNFTYFDPWKGRKNDGICRIPSKPIVSTDAKTSSCLELELSAADIGRKLLRANETSHVVPVVIIGRW